jgi:putative phosphoesterase
MSQENQHMATRLLLISDTHIPGRARRLPDAVLKAADMADLVIHADDWVAASVLEELEQHADVLGVWGNNDGKDLRGQLPEVSRRVIYGVRFAVVHETGQASGREIRMDATYPDVDVLVFGHSHIPWDSTATTGLRLLNPGSPTDRRRQPFCTYMTARVDDGALDDVILHRLERPGA